MSRPRVGRTRLLEGGGLIFTPAVFVFARSPTGFIPAELGKLAPLGFLHLAGNKLSGESHNPFLNEHQNAVQETPARQCATGFSVFLQKKENTKSLLNLLDSPSNLLVPSLRNFKALRSNSSLWMGPEDTHVKKVCCVVSEEQIIGCFKNMR